MSALSLFKTQDGATKYLSAYDATLALLPVSHDAMDVETRFGITHLNVAGPEVAPALLVLHGGFLSSTVWHPNIAALSRDFRGYAPDVIDP